MKKIVLTIILSSLPFNSHAFCANKKEINAFNLRALQSSMMVAALSCGQQKQYNNFITKYKDNIESGGNDIKEYFHRVYGSSHERELNKFITKMANDATKLSMQDNDEDYCKHTKKAFNEILKVKDNGIDKYIQKRKYSALHGVNSCL